MFEQMDLAHWLVVLSAGISVFGAAAYIRDTVSGKTKPNLVSWSMWAIAPLIGTFAAFSANADFWATLRIFLAGFLPLLILISSFTNRQSYWKLGRFDILCGLFSLLALIIWGTMNSPRSAILLAATADGFASLPTIVKAWKFPETETGWTYIASFISVALIIPSIPEWNIENASFQVYLLAANAALVVAVFRRKLGL